MAADIGTGEGAAEIDVALKAAGDDGFSGIGSGVG